MSNHALDLSHLTQQHRGLAILKALQRETSQSSNEEVMRAWLEELALGGTREQVRMELERLGSLGLIRTEWRGFKGETMVFRLTEGGLDYLEFRVSIASLPRIGPAINPY